MQSKDFLMAAATAGMLSLVGVFMQLMNWLAERFMKPGRLKRMLLRRWWE